MFHLTSSLITIQTSYGKLRGVTKYRVLENDQYFFKGIPFAKPPIGQLRFELPEIPEKWSAVLDATTFQSPCMTYPRENILSQKRMMSEDCLYLNIYTNEKCLKSKCPVIVYYHGGAFNIDSATMFPDDFILKRYVAEDVVFVIPAFRLGTFALLNFGDPNAIQDNIPAHDAKAALLYVHNEIHNFGGDPNQITLMGHSSGASLIGAFTFSSILDPDSKLFHRAIMLSGPDVYENREHLEKKSWDFAERVGCISHNTSKNAKDTIDCLKTKSAFKLLAVQLDMDMEGKEFESLVYGPPFMNTNENTADFLRKTSPRNILIGSTEYELVFAKKKENRKPEYHFFDFKNEDQVKKEIEKRLEKNETNFDFTSASIFVSTIQFAAAMTEAGGKAYVFETRQKPYSNHVSDMQYFIGVRKEPNPTPNQIELNSIYSKFLVNFTKTGVPATEWVPFNISLMNFLNLQFDSENGVVPTMENDYHRDDYSFYVEEMKSFDQNITNQREESTTLAGTMTVTNIKTTTLVQTPKDSDLEITTEGVEESFSIFGQWWFWMAILVVLLILAFVIVEIFKTRQEELEPLLNHH